MSFNFQSNYYVKNVWKLLMWVSDLYLIRCEWLAKELTKLTKNYFVDIEHVRPRLLLSGDCLKIILSLEYPMLVNMERHEFKLTMSCSKIFTTMRYTVQKNYIWIKSLIQLADFFYKNHRVRQIIFQSGTITYADFLNHVRYKFQEFSVANLTYKTFEIFCTYNRSCVYL